MLLYDSSTRQKVELPAPPGPIRMYVCGPTVYQRIHIGNARPFVVSMWMRQWLAERGYEVKLVENITDINDKIYEAAARQKMGSAELAEQAAQWYIDDTDELGLGRPDVEPRATEVIPEIVALIGELIDRGLAYESGGDVYFRVPAYPEYGSLSGAQPDDMIAQEPSDLKEDPRDFALWKATKAHEDTEWDSPWGPGRPGWHIECSAMAEKHLGPVFEIHGGGLDLRFPHHENELAQSRGAGRPFARFWAHNGMLQLSRGEDVEVDRATSSRCGRCWTPTAARRSWSSSSAATTAARSTTRTRRWRRRRVSPTTSATLGEWWRRGKTSAAGMPSPRLSTTTSTRRRPLPSCTNGAAAGRLDLLCKALLLFGLAASPCILRLRAR